MPPFYDAGGKRRQETAAAPRAGACYADRGMFDTLAVAQQLAAGGVAREQAEVIAKAIHDGLEQGDHVTADQFRAGLAEVRTEIANLDTRLSTQIAELRAEQRTQIAGVRTGIASLETRLIRWMVGTVIATATLTVGILRLIG